MLIAGEVVHPDFRKEFKSLMITVRERMFHYKRTLWRLRAQAASTGKKVTIARAAAEAGIPDGTVRGWKSQYSWFYDWIETPEPKTADRLMFIQDLVNSELIDAIRRGDFDTKELIVYSKNLYDMLKGQETDSRPLVTTSELVKGMLLDANSRGKTVKGEIPQDLGCNPSSGAEGSETGEISGGEGHPQLPPNRSESVRNSEHLTGGRDHDALNRGLEDDSGSDES